MWDTNTKCNLFAYGSLRHAAFIESITGDMHEGHSAVLHGYKKFYTPFGFPFILPHLKGRVHGKIYFDISPEALEKIDHFECEGTLYDRKSVSVSVQGKPLLSQAYIANLIHIRRSFGPNMDLALVEKAEKFIESHVGERIEILMTKPLHAQSEIDITAMTHQELFGAEIFNLLNMLLLDKYVSDYTIDSHLKVRGRPSLEPIRRSSEKTACANRYMWLAMRFMVLNQLEENFRHQFRTELFIRWPYSRFTQSLLAALILYNRHREELDTWIRNTDNTLSPARKSYFEYANHAVQIAQQFHQRHLQETSLIVRELLMEPKHGHVPLGAELEFSNAGRCAVHDHRPADPDFHHFRYFFDFELDRRSWKLGGYVDDHKFSPIREKTQGGFLEYSLGKTDIFQHDSQPVTDDPRILARLIQELILYTPVKPHSLHLSFQDTGPDDIREGNDPEMLKCCLLLGGELSRNADGELIEQRLHYRETSDPWGGVHFIRENFHHLLGTEEEKKPLRVLEYQFPRLRSGAEYEPLIMAFKGFHLGYRPRPLSSVATTRYQDASRAEIQELCRWADQVEPLGEVVISEFLEHVETGLLLERKKARGHAKKYIQNMLFEIEKSLRLQNEWIENARKKEHGDPASETVESP
jgi:gamma-glutamylcyclotransferase (GGCT)/AIG2-like uncharacterized protein YtfP